MKCSPLPLAGAAILAASSTPLFAQCEGEKVLPLDPATRAQFGIALDMFGTRAIVGARLANGTEGAAYVFDLVAGSWTESAKLASGDPGLADEFGDAVALGDDIAIVGAREDGAGNRGAAYVFERAPTGWAQTQKLVGSDSAVLDRFGWRVALEGDLAAISAASDDVVSPLGGDAQDAGSVYVFERSPTGWVESAKLIASDASENDSFGRALEVSDGRVFVGAPFAEGGGAVYVFEPSPTGWVETARVASEDGDGDFGQSLAVADDLLVVGAPGERIDGALNAGAAHVFERAGARWSPVASLQSDQPMEYDQLARSLATDGDVVLAGAIGADDLARSAGVVFVFERSSDWSLVQKLAASDGAEGDHFGMSVTLEGDLALVGAALDDDGGEGSGSVYAINLAGSGAVTPYCPAIGNTSGGSAELFQNGSLSISGNQFAVRVTGTVQYQPAALFYGALPTLETFGNGFLCVRSPIFRAGSPGLTDGDGVRIFPVDFDALPASAGPGMITAGSTWHFQVWFRDPPAGLAAFNFSSALAVTFCP